MTKGGDEGQNSGQIMNAAEQKTRWIHANWICWNIRRHSENDLGEKLFNVKPNLVDETPVFLEFWKYIEKVVGVTFNSCNVSYYGNELAETGPHSDDEGIVLSKPKRKREPFQIVSVSLLSSREFELMHKTSGVRFSVWAGPFDILIMEGKFQWEFKHSVPQMHSSVGPRLNFTFRNILTHKNCPLCAQNWINLNYLIYSFIHYLYSFISNML